MTSGRVAIFTVSDLSVKIVQEPVVQPGPDEILVRVSLAGICGSDMHRLKGHVPQKTVDPVCFGHEAVGVIESLGAEVTEDRAGVPLAVGDTLYWMPLAPCETCWECSKGDSMSCKELDWPPVAGSPNGAGFRQYATIKKRSCYIRVPPGLRPEYVLAFGCALPTALRGFQQLGVVEPGADFVIQGCGPVGLASTILAKLAGARSVFVIGDPAHRLDVAATLGATHTVSVSGTTGAERLKEVQSATSGRGASIVIEATGAAAAIPEAIDLLGVNGRYLILGMYSGNTKCLIDPVQICRGNLRVIGSLGIDVSSFQRTVDIASEYGAKLGFANLITHRFSLDDLEKALRLVGDGTPVKAVIDLQTQL